MVVVVVEKERKLLVHTHRSFYVVWLVYICDIGAAQLLLLLSRVCFCCSVLNVWCCNADCEHISVEPVTERATTVVCTRARTNESCGERVTA